ncbi:MAG: hypothetical protein KGI54_15740, partial [Pseudomonadota bacterium]|nr:hypothetical protein [Pseudomonadota bacterium]
VDVTEKAIDRVIDSQNSPMRLVKTKELKSTNIELFNSTYTVKAADLKPANAQLLLDLLEKLPNPDFVDRQSYETIMLAIAGCHWSLLELQELSIKDSQNIGIAAAQWASRWEGATKSDFETEHTKWQNDWSQRSPYRIGWRTLLNFASDIGMDLSPIKNSEAQTLFKADSDPKPQYSPLESSFGDNSEHIISDRSELTEFWLASQFLKKANNRIRYLPESKQWIANHPTKGGWFSQIANSWVNDQIQRFLHELSENMGKLSRDDINRLLRWSMVQRIENLCQDRVAITRDALNDAAWFLQTPAGAFDLRTGNKIPILQQQKNLDMRYTNYTPEKGATPMWDMLIDHLADDDKETAEWVKYYAAYSLIGDPCAQKMLFIHGNGGNGKSTLLQVLAGVMGSYAGSIDRDVWLERHTAKHPASLYLIRDLRLAYTSEMPDNEKWYEARLKAVTGQDPIEARVMSGNPVTFSAKAALLMVGNAIPNFHRVDSSIVRRVAIVGTTRAPKERIVKLGEKIIAREGAAILYDLMRRCQEMSQVEDYLPPTTARMNFETNEYLSQNDAGYAWVSSECISGSEAAGLITPLHVLLERFMAFNKRRNQGDVLSMMDSAAAFTEMLQVIKRVGARTKRPNGEEILWDGKPAAEGIGLKVRLAA